MTTDLGKDSNLRVLWHTKSKGGAQPLILVASRLLNEIGYVCLAHRILRAEYVPSLSYPCYKSSKNPAPPSVLKPTVFLGTRGGLYGLDIA
jgi:hypothetical protein